MHVQRGHFKDGEYKPFKTFTMVPVTSKAKGKESGEAPATSLDIPSKHVLSPTMAILSKPI
ncbi:hypothetical protein N7501_000497 [Penicillium viridicatum]|nr:hypothetical protein N7501_000497 [Penicillium viridicatum]